jgi:hypothetical protein
MLNEWDLDSGVSVGEVIPNVLILEERIASNRIHNHGRQESRFVILPGRIELPNKVIVGIRILVGDTKQSLRDQACVELSIDCIQGTCHIWYQTTQGSTGEVEFWRVLDLKLN